MGYRGIGESEVVVVVVYNSQLLGVKRVRYRGAEQGRCTNEIYGDEGEVW